MTSTVLRSFRFAACQISSVAQKEVNLENARKAVEEARRQGAQVVCLPEMFNCPYSNDTFADYAEEAPGGPSAEMLQQTAKDQQVYLIGGSIPERDAADGKLYNTCLVYGPTGALLAKHRKVHLFDIDIPGQMTFQESLTLSAGTQATSFTTEYCNIGVGICYDMRFWELSAKMARDLNCEMFVFPGAFNTTTGPLHWELLLRGRAVDHQVFVAGVSPSRPSAEQGGYPAWGHSTIVDPWGRLLATTDEKDALVISDIDLSLVDQIRQRIPVRIQRRPIAY